MGNSAIDLLIAEMLGDIRHLHNEVIALKDSVPGMSRDFSAAVSDAENMLIGVKESVGQVVVQTAAAARAVSESTVHFDNAKQRLDKAVTGVENIDTSGLGAHQRTTLGLAVLAIVAVCLVAGFFVGKKMGAAQTPEDKFAALNDVRAMLQCKSGTAQMMNDGTKTCAISPDGKVRVIAWRIE